ncbi:MAG: acetylserotonin O-methyltransferase [Nitrospirota bacterium]|nr:acetylserotonin O-methyltransferase [Nitrospirota bacterium]
MKRAKHDAAAAFAQLWGGFRASRVLLTANNLRIFEQVGAGTSASGLASVLRTDLRATEILLDALAALGLLKKQKVTYSLTPLAKQFLLPGSPAYQGDMLRHADTLWKSWSGLDEVVRSGMPNRTGERDHDVFIRAMHNNALPRVRQVISALDLRGVRQALDLGGGPGTYSIALAKKGIAVTLFDLPNTIDVAREIVRTAGAKKISFRGGDFHFDDIGGPYDLVLLSQILHSHGPLENRALLAKTFEALAPGGTIAVHEFSLDDDRAGPLPGALFSVNMVVNTSEGRSYTAREIGSWLREAGCSGIKTKRLGDTVLVLGKKK